MRSTIPSQREIEETIAEMRQELTPLQKYRAELLKYAVPNYVLSWEGEFIQTSYDQHIQYSLDWIKKEESAILKKYKDRLS